MNVSFERTGSHRYAVVVHVPGRGAQRADPAPGYDDDIPHDLVHYVVEAELGLSLGVFGRAAAGGGTFYGGAEAITDARERSRAQRRQQKREAGLRRRDDTDASDMATSERLAGMCDLAWRRSRGQRRDATRVPPPSPTPSEAASIERVVRRLDLLAPRWRALAVGEALVFTWPGLKPASSSVRHSAVPACGR